MLLGGFVMAAVPVTVWIAGMIFLFKKYREETRLADQEIKRGGAR